MKSLRIPFLALSILAMSALSAYAAQLSSAKVIAVEGSVSKYSPGGSSSQLAVGDILVEGDSVSATALSSAMLVFSNGSEIVITENTSISIAKLQQDSFSGNQSYEQLQADPSKSQVLLELNYGELDGHVKSLRQGSTFDVETPLGTAAIRGTKFKIKLFFNAEREEFILIIFNKDGKVNINSRYVGNIEYGQGNVGNIGYNTNLEQAVSEPIPVKHTVAIRLSRHDPGFDALYDLMKNRIPIDPGPGFIKLPLPEFTPDDPGVIVVSPEDQGNP